MRARKAAASRMVQAAVQGGYLTRPERCSECGKIGKIQGHHPDYDKPLEVEWLCPSCHARRHHPILPGSPPGPPQMIRAPEPGIYICRRGRCGKRFEAMRPARACSEACRMALWREEQRGNGPQGGSEPSDAA